MSLPAGSIWPATTRRIARAHGGPDKAVYAYAVEDLGWWAQEIGRPLQYGELGENLTTEGIDVNGALIGERWAIGTTVLEVSEPRVPCWRLGVRMNDKLFPRRFVKALRPGAYFRILVEGDVGVGDEIRVIESPDHDLTIRDILRIYAFDQQEVGRLLAIPGMSESWRGGRNNTCKTPRAKLPRQPLPDAVSGRLLGQLLQEHRPRLLGMLQHPGRQFRATAASSRSKVSSMS